MADETTYSCIPDPSKRIIAILLAPYRCKVIFGTGEWGLFGRGSLTLAKAVAAYGDTDTSKPAIVVGDFCEMADQCTIMLGAEHRNYHQINHTFHHFPALQRNLVKQAHAMHPTFSRGTIEIGHNVTLSHGMTVRSGTQIGNGAVIGADSFVSAPVPAFAIAAGVPATVRKMRFEETIIAAMQQARWWDWELDYLAQHLSALYTTPVGGIEAYLASLEPVYTRRTDDYFVLTPYLENGRTEFQCEGVERDGHFMPISALPETCQLYLAQAKAPAGSNIMVMHHFFSYLA